MPAEPDDLPQQLILGRYRPLEELGEGGFGSVVLAWDTKMQRRVAIKRLPLSGPARRGLGRQGRPTRDSGLAEARTAALLDHPDIVTVYEWDSDSDEAFLIMEYVAGASIAEILDDGGALDLDEAAAVLDPVFAAVEFAHENGVLHLDIKPQNVLVSRGGRAKVADLGISALSTATGHTAALGGTPGYMPPEQLRGEQVDERTDVWALGALAFEVLADANPFVSDSVEGALFKIEIAEPSTPGDFDPALSPEIDDVIMTALSADPAERYPSVTRFAAALLPLLGDERLGQTELAERVDAFVAEQPAEEERLSWERVGLWDRARPYAMLLARVLAGAAAAWLGYFGLVALRLSGTPAIVGAALAAAAGALAPALGIALGVVLFSAGLAAQGAYVLATLLFVAAALDWWFLGRRNAAAALFPFGAPLLAASRFSLATPFLAGFALPPLQAALTAFAGGALATVAWAASPTVLSFGNADWRLIADPLAALTAQGETASAIGARLHVVWTTPFAYVVLLTWAVAAAAMSVACRRASRPAAFLGTAIAAGILWGGYVLAGSIAALGGPSVALLSWETLRDPFARQMTASLILVVLVTAAGPPVRPEEE